MDSNLFKIQGCGLDTSTLVSVPLERGSGFSYLYTSLSANNEFLVRDALKEKGDIVLIVGADFLDEVNLALDFHLQSLERMKTNLFLIPCSKDIEKYGEDLRKLMESGRVDNIGLKFPRDLSSLKLSVEALGKFGIEVKYVALELCPYNFDYSILEWCKGGSVEILGFNPFGGFKNSGCMISAFTAPYLLGFSATYSSLIFLSGRNIDISYDSKAYIESLVGKERTSKYILRKSVHKLFSGFGDIIGSSIVLKENLSIPLGLPEYLYPFEELSMSFGKSIPDIEGEFWNFDTNNIEEAILGSFNYLRKPEDGNDEDFLSIIRPKIIQHLSSVFYNNLPIEQVKLGRKVFMISCPKYEEEKVSWWKFWKPRNRTLALDTYLLYYGDGRFLFRSYDFASQKA